MSRFARNIRPHVNAELAAARAAEAQDPALAFRHLERAHVLGQASTVQHVRAHWQMLRWAIRQRCPGELAGQLLRLVGAASKTALGLVPSGNTGGSNVSPFKAMPLPADLAATIELARAAP